MKTLKDKETDLKTLLIYRKDQKVFFKENVKETLNNFYDDYWKNSYRSDKCKSHITCDVLDYLLNKHFGSIIKIETLQKLENQ